MTQKFFPFDTGAGANVTEDQWRQMAQLWLPTGVVAGQLNGLETFGDSSGMQVKTKSGRAWLQGHFYESDAQVTLAIAAADATNPRYDMVVVRADFSANTIALAVVTGTPAASPVPPALTRSTTVWETAVAIVLIDPAVGLIAANKVFDARAFVGGGAPIRGSQTTEPSIATSAAGVFAVNWVHYARFVWPPGGAMVASKLAFEVTVSSGNISAAVYENEEAWQAGAGSPATRLATSGAVACPAIGHAEVSLGASVAIAVGSHWGAISADNTTAQFKAITLPHSVYNGSTQRGGGPAHPCPADGRATLGGAAANRILMAGV